VDADPSTKKAGPKKTFKYSNEDTLCGFLHVVSRLSIKTIPSTSLTVLNSSRRNFQKLSPSNGRTRMMNGNQTRKTETQMRQVRSW
jgi:hypothetical protein